MKEKKSKTEKIEKKIMPEEVPRKLASAKKIDVKIEVQKEKEADAAKQDLKKLSPLGLALAILIGGITYFFNRELLVAVVVFALVFIMFFGYLLIRRRLIHAADVKKMEDVFPDFIGLMASNLRAGMTIDRALLMSSRKEFAPLDKQIVLLGKDIVTGKEINKALEDMGKRIGSQKIIRTIRLIISGIKSGGNLAVLLEETAQNMRERGFVEKRAASNVLMYVIFIFFASAIGGPVLFGLSTILVEVMSKLVEGLPSEGTVSNIPFALTSVNISLTFVIYFSLIFITVTNFLGSLVLGLVSKGKERDGLKYTLPMILLGIGVFILSRVILSRYFADLNFGI